MEYVISPVPSEVKLLKEMRRDEMQLVEKAFSKIKPGVTKVDDLGNTENYEVDIVALRRMYTGESQRGRSAGWKNAIVEGGDMISAPSQGKFAYVLSDGETEPPAEIQKLWNEYLKIDKIFAETIKAGLTPRKIIENYKILKQSILKEKPNGIKGEFILSSYLSSTMGISYKLKVKG